MVTPYLSFAGTCEEAMTFYKSALGGELAFNHFGGSPMESEVPPEFKTKVMHASLTSPHGTLMASDSWHPMPPGNHVSLSIAASSAEAPALFEALSSGGSVMMPLGEVFWGGSFGMLTDKYGFTWMISVN
jgi:PhnB protein